MNQDCFRRCVLSLANLIDENAFEKIKEDLIAKHITTDTTFPKAQLVHELLDVLYAMGSQLAKLNVIIYNPSSISNTVLLNEIAHYYKMSDLTKEYISKSASFITPSAVCNIKPNDELNNLVRFVLEEIIETAVISRSSEIIESELYAIHKNEQIGIAAACATIIAEVESILYKLKLSDGIISNCMNAILAANQAKINPATGEYFHVVNNKVKKPDGWCPANLVPIIDDGFVLPTPEKRISPAGWKVYEPKDWVGKPAWSTDPYGSNCFQGQVIDDKYLIKKIYKSNDTAPVPPSQEAIIN